ncbi:MAG: hypothetical protein CMG48_01255 [Candidatus Marinimicrobia bacterium]|nr:hypothetical protein [Candidatus Neomarinimicrobiota bacterium]|tara:strand:+ start:9644 stop:9856 length:213 start_codon:yes stop_codon:yes gene_type:complete
MGGKIRIHDLNIGTKLKLIRNKRSSWGWELLKGDIVKLIEIQEQPVKLKVLDNTEREWHLDSHDIELLDN